MPNDYTSQWIKTSHFNFYDLGKFTYLTTLPNPDHFFHFGDNTLLQKPGNYLPVNTA
jgi:hypothetical protein